MKISLRSLPDAAWPRLPRPGVNRIQPRPTWRFAPQATARWVKYYKVTRFSCARRLLLTAIEMAGDSARQPGLAFDIGAGTGAATRALLHHTAWDVRAIDADPAAKHYIKDRFPDGLPPRLTLEQADILEYPMPRGQVDMIWAGLTLPYVPQADIATVCRRIFDSLKPGGVFAGDFFGPAHGHAGRADMNFQTEAQVERLMQDMFIIHIEHYQQTGTFSSGKSMMMDCHHVIVCKP